MTDSKINIAIGRILSNTKRKKRPCSLVEIANDFETALKEKSKNELSEIIGISPNMINKFISVNKLPLSIKNLVEERLVDSVSLVYDLSKLSNKDLIELEPLLKENKINSNELKVFLPFRKQHPNQSIVELYNQQINSKNIKVSVIRLQKNDDNNDLFKIKKEISKLISNEEILDLDINNNYLDIKITKKGELELRKIAKKQNKSFQSLIQEIIL